MKILKGPHAGDGYRPHQWANDWITAIPPDGGQPVIAKPGNVELTPEEADRMLASRREWADGNPRTGLFWTHWQLTPERRFTLTDAARARCPRERRPRERRRPAPP